MTQPNMPSPLATLFAILANYDVIIVGSALRDYDRANDVDVMFMDAEQFIECCATLGVHYNGWDTSRGHVRMANLSPRYIGKKIQLIHLDSVATPDDHPHMTLSRDGTVTKDGVFMEKPPGWRYNKHR